VSPTSTPQPAPHPDNAAGRPPRQESLRRELLAILFLYAAVGVLPCLIGMAFAP
jgi:hypothetical protein